MMCWNIFIKLLISSVFVLCLNYEAEGADISFIDNINEIEAIRQKHVKKTKDYVDQYTIEIRRLLGNPSNLRVIESNMLETMSWWKIDVDRRHDFSLYELTKIMPGPNENENYQKLKEQLDADYDFADQFWKSETDKSMNIVRENPEVYKERKNYVPEHPAPTTLSPENQKIYEKQIHNLRQIPAYTKALIRAYYHFVDPQLPSKDNRTFITYQVKKEMALQRLSLIKSNQIDTERKLATNRVTDAWSKEGKNGPTEEEFQKEYDDLLRYGVNLINNLDKSFKLEYEDFELMKYAIL